MPNCATDPFQGREGQRAFCDIKWPFPFYERFCVATVLAVPSDTSAGLWEPRYSMVDAWRGLAALGVVFAHLNIRVGFSLGDACVMVFFVISGYCIAAATFSCQRNNLGPAGYMWRRVRRIYPPYFFAVCFFVVTRLVKLRLGMGDELPRSLMVWIQNLSVTQWLSFISASNVIAWIQPCPVCVCILVP